MAIPYALLTGIEAVMVLVELLITEITLDWGLLTYTVLVTGFTIICRGNPGTEILRV